MTCDMIKIRRSEQKFSEMADLKEDKINFGKLEKELFAAVEADAAYWRENDAKLRAMDQRVESYDQFKDMVAAAHIKPLDKKDKFGQGKRMQPWNPFSSPTSSSSSSSSSSTSPTTNDLKACSTKGIPKNGHEFTKEWRKQKKILGACYSYLLEIGGESLSKVFKSEISFGLLGEIIGALEERMVEDDCGKVADILMCLSRAGRFGLALDFLSKEERCKLSDLVLKLEEWTKHDKTDAVSTDTCDKSGTLSEDGNGEKEENSVQEGSSDKKDLDKGKDSSSGTKYGEQIDIDTLRMIYKLEEK